MSEPANVRLVRCPKCQNLLTELPDYSVYECGGCGAVLRAKRTNGEVDALSVKSDEERIGGVLDRLSEKYANNDVSEKRMSYLIDESANDIRSNGSAFNRADRRRFLHDRIENYGASSSTKTGLLIVEDGLEMDMNINGRSHIKMDREFENMKLQRGNGVGLPRSGEMPNWAIGQRSEMESFQRVQRIDVLGMSFSASNYPEPSNYQYKGGYGYAASMENRNEVNGFHEVQYPGDDRVELLQKLDELRDQLSRSCDVSNRKVPLDRRIPQYNCDTPEKWFPEGYSVMQNSFPGKHAARPAYLNPYVEMPPFVDRHGKAGYGFFPPTHSSGHVHEFEDPLRPELLRRGPHQPSAPFQQKPLQYANSGQYIGGNIAQIDPRESYSSNLNNHPSLCPCFHCYDKYRVPIQVPPNTFGNRPYSDGAGDQARYPQRNPTEFPKTESQFSDHRSYGDHGAKKSGNPSFTSHNSQLSGDLFTATSGFGHSRASKVSLSNSGRRCQPIAGGAPFLSCQNCFEMLQLPTKAFTNGKKQIKIRCGGCSELIVLVVDTKGIVVSLCEKENKINATDDGSCPNNLNEGSLCGPNQQDQASVNFYSEDFDNSSYDFQPMDKELGSLSTGWGSSNKSRDVKNHHSVNSFSSDEEERQEKSPAKRKESNSPELLVEAKVSPPPAGSPLQEYFDYSNKYNVVKHIREGNKSVPEEDKADPEKTISRQNSLRDTSATEISSNEYSYTGTSLDSGEASKEGHELRANKAAGSLFAGIMKRSSMDLKNQDSTERENANVTVNGNLIPDRLIRRAEKLAGPIQPGNYWYDFRAGFWGVMGGSCLGIIPPFIEEFNYPMPENCTGGKTGVLVNGRELRDKDLDLLVTRGLPAERDRSYIIEVSGRVLDELTGEELESLGKLAPTVEKLKRGFGMKIPKAIA